MAENYLIIGSGPAGITAAENVRNLDNKGEITVISEERVPMFYRPRIPEYAVGKVEIEEIMVKRWISTIKIELDSDLERWQLS